ncbi:hypothetical protein TWF481_001144 [Arthrobotrys musiformis]|uniref:Uncharacterized protein n=1 Tax=Arthrobotrys musiformis TaxID=47236 RepID=A0AAV9WQJ5_9PEZI
MASKKNRGTYRAVGLNEKTTEDDLRNALMNALTPEERKTMSISKLCLAPSPTEPHNKSQTAIFKVQGGTPKFLEKIDSVRHAHINEPNDEYGEIEIDSDFWGLTQLYPTTGDIRLDIVALSGLNAHAYGSWSGPTEKNPMWLHDFLSRENGLGPHCRSMIYGYNAKTADSSTHDTGMYAEDLLHELNKARATPEAFTRGSWDDEFNEIHNSIIRIMCFGVPYRGIDLEDVGRQIESNLEKFHQGSLLLRDIQYEGGKVTTHTKMFGRLLKLRKTRLASFFETRSTKKVEAKKDENGKDTGEFARIGKFTQVVPEESAKLGLATDFEDNFSTDGDHSTIVKFTNTHNRTYITITGILRGIVKSGRDEVRQKIAVAKEEKKQQTDTAERVTSGLNAAAGKLNWSPEEQKYRCNQMLRLAAHADLYTTIEKLLDHGADPNIQIGDPKYDRFQNVPWIFDLNNGSAQAGTDAKDHQRAIADVLKSDDTPLALATKQGNIRVVRLLLGRGANPNLPCSAFEDGETPLHEASKLRQDEIARLLLQNGANPDVKTDTFEVTPLHEAASSGSAAVALVLISFKADVHAKKLSGDTPLHIAADEGYQGLISCLRDNGADVAARNEDGSTPIHLAAQNGHALAVDALLYEKGRLNVVDIKNDDGETALYCAIASKKPETVKKLLEHGARRTNLKDFGPLVNGLDDKNREKIEALLDNY